MKLHSIKYIMLFMLFFNSSLAFSSEDLALEEFVGGSVILDLDDSEDLPEGKLIDYIEGAVEANKFFEKNYPGEKIDEDMTEDLAKFFPDLNQQDLLRKEKVVRRIVKTYRFGRGVFEYFKAKKIVPEEPAIVVDDSQYTSNVGKQEYIEALDGHVNVITDIKKVVSYSSDPRDVKAMRAKRERELESKDRKNKYEKLYSMLKKVEWKKFFTGEAGYSPFTGDLGVGYWYKTDELNVRYLSERSHIDNSKFVRMLLDFRLKSEYHVKASSLEDNPYFSIDFSNSKNYEKFSIFYPTPKRISFEDGQTSAVYSGSFSIPIIMEVSSVDEDLDLQSKIFIELCNKENICEKKELNPFFDLDYGEGMNSVVNNYIIQSYAALPMTKDEKLELLSIVSKEENDEKFLEIKIKNKYNIENIDIFVDSKGGTKLYDPIIYVDRDIITAKVKQLDSNEDIIGKDIVVTVSINNIYSIRSTVKVLEKPLFDVINSKIPLKTILLALLSGLLISFMPPVLPIFVKYLEGLNQYGGRRYSSVFSGFLAMFMGVLFSVVVSFLLVLYIKSKSLPISWGMQFQSPIFLISILFMLLFFIADISGLLKIRRFSFINDNFKKNDISFFMGVLVFLFALAFGSPYIGSVLGYISNAQYLEVITILFCLLLGFFLPYLLFICFPFLLYLVPSFRYWNAKNNKIVLFLLYFSIVWLSFVYGSFAGLWAFSRFLLYAVLLYIIIYFRKSLVVEVDRLTKNIADRKLLTNNFRKVTTILMFILYFVAVFDARFSYQNKASMDSNRETEIDYAAIAEYIDEGKVVVVNITADWCITCKFNDFAVFGNTAVKSKMYNEKVVIMHIDWTRYNQDVLDFMKDYGRSSPPFSIVYSKAFKEGIVMPEILNETRIYRTVGSISR